MMIRHSIRLLEQLSKIEATIHQWEKLAQEKGLQLESEALLQLALIMHVHAQTLTGK
jgi:hypothetical protein